MKITTQQKKQFSQITQEYELNFIALFGSRVQKCERENSDIDIAVSAKEKIDYRKEFLLQRDLGKVYGVADIDLVQTSDASPLLMFGIAFKSQLLCERTKHSFAHFQMYAFKRYVEAKPLFALQRKLLTASL